MNKDKQKSLLISTEKEEMNQPPPYQNNNSDCPPYSASSVINTVSAFVDNKVPSLKNDEEKEVNITRNRRDSGNAAEAADRREAADAEEKNIYMNPENCEKEQLVILSMLLEKIEAKQSIFITGGGGTGKSHMLKQLYNAYRLKHEQGAFILSSTGVSAHNIGGGTVHWWGGMKKGEGSIENIMRYMNTNAKVRWRTSSVLFIDEISMLGASFFDKLDQIGKTLRHNQQPFGGIILVISGDFLQLPPVNDSYAFKSEAWKSINFVNIKLNMPWRFQGNLDHFFTLSRIRLGKPTEEDIQIIQRRVEAYREMIKQPDIILPTNLYSRRMDVDAINYMEMNKINEDCYSYVARDNFSLKKGYGNYVQDKDIPMIQEIMSKNVLPEVSLKKGCQVMLTSNISVNDGLANGSRGVVIDCTNEFILVKFKNGKTYSVSPFIFTLETDKYVFTRVQIPLRLSYATTIHKSQGLTLDSALISIGYDIFENNMSYVALSRVRDFDSLYIDNFDPNKIRAHPDALEFEMNQKYDLVINSSKQKEE